MHSSSKVKNPLSKTRKWISNLFTSPSIKEYEANLTEEIAAAAADRRVYFVTNFLQINADTAAMFEQAIKDGTHLTDREGFGEMILFPKDILDYHAARDRARYNRENPSPLSLYRYGKPVMVMVPCDYIKYLDQKTALKKREDLERVLAWVRERCVSKYKPNKGTIKTLEERIAELQPQVLNSSPEEMRVRGWKAAYN
ncbi:hypothetical protein IL306_004517 [Fusarium sp. DS 682]|nr:hypothetical protein IL306_004517 [Fusarium sp. DS 682]